MHELCVGGDMVILFFGSFHGKMTISPPTQPTDVIFGRVIDIASIFYHTKNQVGGSCVGGVSNEARRILPRLVFYCVNIIQYSFSRFFSRKKKELFSILLFPKIFCFL